MRVCTAFSRLLRLDGVRELAQVRVEYNTVRLHAGIGYLTPDDEHEGRGPHIRRARRVGLMCARRQRIAYHRLQHRQSQPPESR